MRNEQWSAPRRYEDDWVKMGWEIVESDLLLPFLFVVDGAPPCALMPRFFRGPAREYAFCGMMMSVAERFPDEPNPLSVQERPTEERVRRQVEAFEESLRTEGLADQDRVLRWGRPQDNQKR